MPSFAQNVPAVPIVQVGGDVPVETDPVVTMDSDPVLTVVPLSTMADCVKVQVVDADTHLGTVFVGGTAENP